MALDVVSQSRCFDGTQLTYQHQYGGKLHREGGCTADPGELGLVLVAPDASPRGDGGPRDPTGSYDFGLGAGFSVDATQPSWSRGGLY